MSERSETEKNKFHVISFICRILTNGTNEMISKTETDIEKKTYVPKRGNGRGRVKLGV